MGLFKKKGPKVVDWTERLNKQQEQVENMRSENSGGYQTYGSSESSNYPSPSSNNSASPFPFFAGNTETNNSSSSYGSIYGSGEATESSAEERRKRLGKRLLDMTNKIEDLSNQIYKMQQRIEVLERKMGSGY
ncbi:MAG: hypothetical protein KC516_01425 [Nanoarchaeota archaeon]|nr:hypothetical protein [Nanoarchaeota archaeon]